MDMAMTHEDLAKPCSRVVAPALLAVVLGRLEHALQRQLIEAVMIRIATFVWKQAPENSPSARAYASRRNAECSVAVEIEATLSSEPARLALLLLAVEAPTSFLRLKTTLCG